MFNFLKKSKKESKNETKQNKAVKADTKKSEAREKAILSVMEKSGLSREEVVKQIKDARKRLGISYRDYDRNDFYTVPVEKQEEAYKNILAKKELRKRQKEHRVMRVMAKTGWDFAYAEAQMEDTKKRLGVTYRDYLVNGLYEVPVEEQEQRLEELKEEKKRERQERFEKIVAKVMEETGWDHDYASAEIKDARKRTGCTYNEYMVYKFYNLDKATQEEVFVAHESRKITAKYDVDNEFINILYSKELSNKYFSEYLGRPWCINTDTTLEEFKEKFANSKKVFYKPLDGHHGSGAEVFELNSENIEEVYNKVSTYTKGVVEQFVVQHHKMSELAPAAVNTVRVVTVASNTQPVTADGKMMDVAYASLKMGGPKSIVDNLAGGGMVAAVDLETGKLITNAVDGDSNVHEQHPATGMTIKGFEIPYFKEVLELVKDAHEKLHLQGYLGWDIAVTENGPEVIEVNVVPGVILFSLPYAMEKRGMKHIMEKYL